MGIRGRFVRVVTFQGSTVCINEKLGLLLVAKG